MKTQLFFCVFVLAFLLGWMSGKAYWEQIWKENAFLEGQNHGMNWGLGQLQKCKGLPTATPLPTPIYLQPGDSVR